MSYGIDPYAIDLGILRKVPGSKDRSLVEQVTGKYSEEYRLDWTYHKERGELAADEALSCIVEGNLRREDCWGSYVEALKLLCRHFGTFLPNDFFSSIYSDWLDSVDEALREARISLQEWISSGPPFTIPYKGGIPDVGHLSPKDVVDAFRRLRQARVKSDDPDLSGALREIDEWLETAQRQRSGLVLFYF